MISKSKARCVKCRMKAVTKFGSALIARTATRKRRIFTDILKESIFLCLCPASSALKLLIVKKLWPHTRKSICLVFLYFSG